MATGYRPGSNGGMRRCRDKRKETSHVSETNPGDLLVNNI
jgi:hypothetical protein